MVDIREYLATKSAFLVEMKMGAPEGWAYPTYEAMLLDLGQPFERKPLPKGFRKMTPNVCFRNATRCVLRDPDRYRYVEGYAGVFFAEHGWVLDTEDGKVFDPTWPRDDNHIDYFGVVFPTAFVERRMIQTRCYGIRGGDWMCDGELLRLGEKAWA